MQNRNETSPKIIYDIKAISTTYSHTQCDCDCDCACSFTYEAQNRHKADWLSEQPYCSNFRTMPLHNGYAVCYHAQNHPPVVLNHAALDLPAQFHHPCRPHDFPEMQQKKQQHEIILPFLEQAVILGLLSPEREDSVPLSTRSTTLTAWLHTTNRCNLRCSYCYVTHDDQEMSFDTGQKCLDAIFRSALRHHYKHVKLKYSGGEPLFRFPLILKLHRYAQQKASEHGISLDGVILSNGTLLNEEMLDTIRSMGMRLMISLDGLGEYHDKQRLYANGNGSSADVLRAIELALECDVVPDISISVSEHNIAGLSELLDWLLARDLPFSLNFQRESVHSKHQTPNTKHQTLLPGLLAAYKVIEKNLPRCSLLTSLADRANLGMPHLRTCSGGQSYLVFDTQGRISKCQMQMDTPVTTADADAPLSAIRENPEGIQNCTVEKKRGMPRM